MNKKEFIILFVGFVTTFILLIEHLCGVPFAFECMCFWAIISLVAFICVVAKYIKIKVVEVEDEE